MKRFVFSDERGQGLAEYGLLITAVVLTAVGVLSLLGVQVSDVVCQVAEGFGSESICSSMLFSDDFGGGADRWHSLYRRDKNWITTDGDDPELCYKGRGSDGLLANNSDGSDYIVSTDANLTSGNGYGIYFHTNENEKGRINGYTFQYDPGYRGGQFVMRKWVNGYKLWPPFAAAPAPKGYDWHNVNRHVEIDVKGNVFTASVDGEEVLVGQDDSYLEGGAGLRVWNSGQACFDDFSVRSR